MKINFRILFTGNAKQPMHAISKKIMDMFDEQSEVSEVEVRLKSIGMESSENKVCEIYLKVGDKNIFSVQRGGSFEECSNKALKKLRFHVDQIIQKD